MHAEETAVLAEPEVGSARVVYDTAPEPAVARPRRRRVAPARTAPAHAFDPVTDEIPLAVPPVTGTAADGAATADETALGHAGDGVPAPAPPLRPRRRRIPTAASLDTDQGEVAVTGPRPRRTTRTRSEDDA